MQVALDLNGTLMRYKEILDALPGTGGGWNWTYEAQAKRLSKILDPKLLEAAGCYRKNDPSSPSTLIELRHAIENVQRDISWPMSVREEAAEFLLAVMLYDVPDPPKFRKDCMYCWRTGDGPVGYGLYGYCHVHQIVQAPNVSGVQVGMTEGPKREQLRMLRNEARRAVKYSEELLKSSKPEKLFRLYTGLAPKWYPVINRSESLPTDRASWASFMKQEFPLVVEALGQVDKAAVLEGPHETISFLEQRALVEEEVELYQNPLSWVYPVEKCSAWLTIEVSRYQERHQKWLERKGVGFRSREPELNFEHLMLPSVPVSC